ncbi:MAG: histidine phosphatase family protein [Patescibacteria group bacterium]|nr:histidine phosphatase family protein [Patescibacteria group bacterium]
MNLYFVRHGETEYNALNLFQPEDIKLSDIGLKQSKSLAERFSNPIDIIYSSSMKRAKETAEIVNKSLKKNIICLDCLKERRLPSEFIGKKKDSLETIEMEKIRDLHENDSLWHYSDEENFTECKKRVDKFFSILSEIKEKNVLIVSHGWLIRLIIFSMMEKEFDYKTFCRFADFFKFDNAGITFCKRNKEGDYSVQVLNDHPYLD